MPRFDKDDLEISDADRHDYPNLQVRQPSRNAAPQTNNPAMMRGSNLFTISFIVSSSFFVAVPRRSFGARLFHAIAAMVIENRSASGDRNQIARAPGGVERSSSVTECAPSGRSITTFLTAPSFISANPPSTVAVQPAKLEVRVIAIDRVWRLDSEPAQFRPSSLN